MSLRIIAASVLCLCLLTIPVLQALGQDLSSTLSTQDLSLTLSTQDLSLASSIKKKPTSVPEPSATLLLALALGGVVALKRRRA